MILSLVSGIEYELNLDLLIEVTNVGIILISNWFDY